MSDHLSTQLLDRYHERQLGPAELLALDEHLSSCAVCRKMLREVKPRRVALLALRAGLEAANQSTSDHLPDSQLTGYAEGRLDAVGRELAESHLEFCPQCVAQAEALSDSYRRRAEAAGASPVSAQASPQTLSTKFIAATGLAAVRERLRPVPMSFRVAGAVAVMALLALATLLWLRIQTGRQEIVDHQPSPSPSPVRPSPNPPPGPPPATPAPILLALNDGGGQVTLDAQGNVAGLELLSPADQQRVKTALTTQKVRVPETLRQLGDSSSAPMGGTTGAAFALLGPVGTIVATDRPTFRWRPLDGATGYQVTITDPEAGYREVAASPQLRDANWTLDRPLGRGRVYTWQVAARTEGAEVRAPAPNQEAKFKVLEQARADELERAEKAYAGSRLVMGLLYAEAGLLDEAAREFRALVAANPQSPVAKNLLRDVRAKRRDR